MAKKSKRNNKGSNKQIKRLQGQSTTELGGSGINKYKGFYNEEYKTELKWPNGLLVYEKMMKGDAQVKASVRVCQLPIMAANWFITDLNNEEDPAKREAAEFLDKNLFNHKINFQQFLFEALGMLPYGFSLFEIVFEAAENQVLWGKFAWRKQYSIKRWEMEDGEPGVVQQVVSSFKRVSIPEWKLLLFTNEKEGDSQVGTSILRSAYKHWYMKDNLYKIDAIAAERNGIGVLSITLPSNHKPEDMANAKELGENFYANEQEYIIKPNPDWEVEILSGGSELRDLDPSIKHHNREITKNVLAQFLELGAEASGSRALSEDHSSLFYLSLENIAKNIATVLSKAGKELLKMNGFDLEEYPEVNYSHIGIQDSDKLSTALKGFVDSGLIEADDELEAYVRKIMQLPEKMEQEKDEDGEPKEPKKRANKKQDGDSARKALLEILSPDKDKPKDDKTVKKGGKKSPEAKASEENGIFSEEDTLSDYNGSNTFGLSPAHKKAISEGLKRYWAGIKKTAVPDAKADTPKVPERKLPKIPKRPKLPKLPSSVTDPQDKKQAEKSIKEGKKQAKTLLQHADKMITSLTKLADLLLATKLEKAYETVKQVIDHVSKNKEQVIEALKKFEKAEKAKKESADDWPELPDIKHGHQILHNIKERNRYLEDVMKELNFNEPAYIDDTLDEAGEFSEINKAYGGVEYVASFREYEPTRELYESEKKVEWQRFNDFFNETEADFADESKELLDSMIEGTLARGERALKNNKLADIGKLALGGVVAYKALIKSNYKKSYDFGKNMAADELDILAPKTATKRVTQMNLTADALVDRQMADLGLVAKTTMLDGAARNLSIKETLFNTKIALNKKADVLNRANVGISVIGQVTQARQDVFQDNIKLIESFQYSAILDGGTTKWCASLDGRVVTSDSPEFEIYRPGQHFNCRSMWVAIGVEEKFKPKAEKISKDIPKQDGGVNGFKDLPNTKEYTPVVDKTDK